MPELPDVEIFRRYLNRTSLHKPIEICRIMETDILDDVSKSKLQSALKGNQFTESVRHGKYALVRLKKSQWMTFHFGMTGFLKYFKKEESRPDHVRLMIDFKDGYHLGYDAMRKLGSIGLANNPQSFAENKQLGMDALDKRLTFDVFQDKISNNKMGIKSFLMRQDIVCGIGNIYSDEICFHAKLHPKKQTSSLSEKNLKILFKSIKTVLETAIDSHANPEELPDSYLLPHRKENGKCPGCSGSIRRIKVSGRSAYYCPSCQKK